MGKHGVVAFCVLAVAAAVGLLVWNPVAAPASDGHAEAPEEVARLNARIEALETRLAANPPPSERVRSSPRPDPPAEPATPETEEEAERRETARVDERMARLDFELSSAGLDASREATVRRAIDAHIAAGGPIDITYLTCRTNMCKLEFLHPGSHDHVDLFEALRESMTGECLMRRSASGTGFRSFMYCAPPGQDLPVR